MTTIQAEKLAVTQELDAIMKRLRVLSVKLVRLQAKELGCTVGEAIDDLEQRGAGILALEVDP